MSWRNKKTNNDEHAKRNGQSQDSWHKRRSQMKNNLYDFKTFSRPTGQTQSSNCDQQGQWTNRSNSVHGPEHRENQQNKPNKNFDKSNFTINNDNHQDKIKKKFFFGFKRLEDLCTKDPSEIIFVMSNKSNGFMDLFKQNKEPDWIFLLMNVSAKICSTEFIQSKTLLLTELTSNTFFEHLKTYILNSPTEKNLNRRKNMNEFFDNCLLVFQSITTLFPKTAVERLKDIVVGANIALNGIQNFSSNYIDISETTIVNMNNLFQKLNDIKLTDELKLEEKIKTENIAQFLSPPENFRELTVYPTVVDFEYGEAFLRPNISKGAFHNIEHYLDVQFRLLREDFIAPLREGIGFYKQIINDKQQNQRRKKINNIRIYHDVEFEVKGEFVHDKYGFSLNFDKNKRLKINWEIAKRFMYGSLLLFSENEFRTFFLGVVLERKIELLKQGKLIVELLEGVTPLYNTSLTMVESEVFFEPYKCSMEVLKRIDNTNFPMEKYIVHASNKIDYPFYIDTLLDPYYSIDDLNKFRILYDGEWPSKEQLGLDQMQYKAFKAALTHEFTVIQGPPGTGKTFIGLKIMKTLIQNLYHNQSLLKPILVVCYTNHALDQFMEGILNFTKKVVRIGGQSKSKVIEEYNLRNITRIFRRSITTNRALRNTSNQLKDIMSEIKYLKKCSEFVSYNAGILELSLLKNGMPKKYHGFFKTTLDLIAWLFQDYKYFEVDPVIFIKTMNLELINTTSHSEKWLEVKNKVEEDEDECLQYEADDPDLEYNHKPITVYSITLDNVKLICKELLEEHNRLERKLNEDTSFYNEAEDTKYNFSIMEKIHDYFTIMLQLADDYKLPANHLCIQNLNTVSMKNRWSLYFSWVKTTIDKFSPKIMEYEESYTSLYKQYSELRELENIEIFNQMHVIALTTTGAAKHRVMLEGLESPIVVVEEAAEVLEAHIVSSLTKHCQHLILIGDHKQLRPSNAVYKLAKDFNFDISLFERMVNNEVPCYTLGEQHRMRPEIALLITPSIYTELKNHISVNNRENVRGVTKNLFFLNHNNYEKEIEEISSKSNEHEATFLIMFARHLLLQGYKTDQITILTTYSGQLFHFRSLRKKYSILQGMRITVVDNYQGEESDIILLSLVRSNEKGNVGFLKTENRICVALSRAKLGLYIMGNMENLYNSGKLWKQIKETLINQDSYGDVLTLECAIHSGITTMVSKSDDFNIIMEGGCTMMCKSLLLCGHYCSSICHSYDREHMEIKCRELCNRSCELNHPCTKLCFMDCEKCTVSVTKELPCGHQLQLPCFVDPITFPCEEKVLIVLEKCGHTITKKCHEQDPKCTFKCFDRLDCGHACERNCHKNDDPDHELFKCFKPCEKFNEKCSVNHKCQKLCFQECLTCTVKVNKTLPCGHMKENVPCGKNVDDIICYQSCPRLLTCGHKCYDKCSQPCKPCENQVTKIIPDCGHSIITKCKIKPERKICNQMCERILDCGHKCSNKCSSECTIKGCKEIVLQQKRKLACGHDNVWVLCCDRDKEFRLDSEYLLNKCQEPCLQILNCNDICLGTCGQCKQGRLHLPCNEICNKINPCNHTCKFPCKERCPPCNQKCLYSCIHSKCTNICGKPCETCKERCNWQCRHFACTKRCDEICDRKPCYEPCDLTLNCGHACIGYCGEPCPPLCRVCQKDEVTEIVFGYEDEPDARFIYLEDCKHSIESKALEEWMNQNDEEIALKQCPLCKTPILKTQRFMNQVKVVLEDISIIRKKQFGVNNADDCINIKKKDILKKLRSLRNKLKTSFFIELGVDKSEINQIIKVWNTYCEPLLNYNTRKYNSTITTNDIESLEFVIGLFKSISEYKVRIFKIEDSQMRRTIINQFFWLLSVAFKYARQLSNQQKSDINMEMARNTRIISLYEIMTNKEYKLKVLFRNSEATELKCLVENMEALLISCQKYSLDRDEDIQCYTELINQKMDSIQFITDEERKMIHAAMSTSFHSSSRAQGHWGKCQNGHIYCVTECGGPMQISTCPECKVQIGGQEHRHVPGVTVATEMDGASRLMYQ